MKKRFGGEEECHLCALGALSLLTIYFKKRMLWKKEFHDNGQARPMAAGGVDWQQAAEKEPPAVRALERKRASENMTLGVSVALLTKAAAAAAGTSEWEKWERNQPPKNVSKGEIEIEALPEGHVLFFQEDGCCCCCCARSSTDLAQL